MSSTQSIESILSCAFARCLCPPDGSSRACRLLFSSWLHHAAASGQGGRVEELLQCPGVLPSSDVRVWRVSSLVVLLALVLALALAAILAIVNLHNVFFGRPFLCGLLSCQVASHNEAPESLHGAACHWPFYASVLFAGVACGSTVWAVEKASSSPAS